jgi:hypothetical protein
LNSLEQASESVGFGRWEVGEEASESLAQRRLR